ncbi:trichoplein keratin filament-binding protein isoform X2 [Pseudoliparis swirei]|uniref:trichoplein keratin filament-binding protein isoform X2 n=1 Tax=Pseudoliparis swirei TaxID=2059687 RepID=UPI0024BEB65E|nr:trichoplein keratin filament-binding protein isoform X2 [Pseudoliparis swirei]
MQTGDRAEHGEEATPRQQVHGPSGPCDSRDPRAQPLPGAGRAAGRAAGAGGPAAGTVGAARALLPAAGGPQPEAGGLELAPVLPAEVCGRQQTREKMKNSALLFSSASMSAFNKQRLQEEEQAGLERRRGRLRAVLQEERAQLEAELRDVTPDRSSLEGQLVQKNEALRTAREERRAKLAHELLREHWKKNSAELREAESALHKDHVVGRWQEQISERKRQEVAEQDQTRRFENEYEKTRKAALGRLKQAEEKKSREEQKRMEELREQMEELKLREEEATRLKKEQEALLVKQWELEKMEEDRKKVEERRKKTEMGHFLIRQYRAQLKRRAQQVQEELEADRNILAALLEGQQVDRRMESARRERAVADAAWMKRVIEEQLHLEQEREAEFDILHRSSTCVGETRSPVGEGEESQRTAHARGTLGQTAAAGAYDAEEQRGSGGVPEEKRTTDPGPGAGEGDPTPGGAARRGAQDGPEARDRRSGGAAAPRAVGGAVQETAGRGGGQGGRSPSGGGAEAGGAEDGQQRVPGEDSQPTSVRMDMSILPEANIVLPPKSIWRWQQL